MASPVKIAVIGVVAIAPITRREPVPELPKSSADLRALPVADPGPADPPAARRLRAVSSAPKPRKAPAVLMDILGLQKAGNAGFALGQRAQDQGPLGNGFVARNLGRALEGPGLAGARAGLGLALCIRRPSNDLYRRGHPWQTRPSNNPFFTGSKHLGQGRSWNQTGLPQLRRAVSTTSRSGRSNARNAASRFEPEALYKQRRGRQPEPAAAGVVRAAETEDEEEEDENEDDESEAEEEEEEEAVEEAPLIVAATGEDEDEDRRGRRSRSGIGHERGRRRRRSRHRGHRSRGRRGRRRRDDLLAEVEDEEDDVAGIIDPGIAKDEG